MTSDPYPAPDPVPNSLSRESVELRRKFDTLRALQATSRRMWLIVPLLIIAVFAVFMATTYARLRDNFNRARVQAAVNERAPEVLPIAGEHLLDATRAAMPTYQKLLAERMERVGPELASETIDSFRTLQTDMTAELLPMLDKLVIDSMNDLEPEVQKFVGDLDKDQRRQLLETFQHELTEDLHARVNKMLINELIRMDEVLAKFNVPVDQQQNPAELERELVLAALSLAQYEVSGQDESVMSHEEVMAAFAEPLVVPQTRKDQQTQQAQDQPQGENQLQQQAQPAAHQQEPAGEQPQGPAPEQGTAQQAAAQAPPAAPAEQAPADGPPAPTDHAQNSAAPSAPEPQQPQQAPAPSPKAERPGANAPSEPANNASAQPSGEQAGR